MGPVLFVVFCWGVRLQSTIGTHKKDHHWGEAMLGEWYASHTKHGLKEVVIHGISCQHVPNSPY